MNPEIVLIVCLDGNIRAQDLSGPQLWHKAFKPHHPNLAISMLRWPTSLKEKYGRNPKHTPRRVVIADPRSLGSNTRICPHEF